MCASVSVCICMNRIARHIRIVEQILEISFAHIVERELIYPHRAMAVRLIRKIVRILFSKPVRAIFPFFFFFKLVRYHRIRTFILISGRTSVFAFRFPFFFGVFSPQRFSRQKKIHIRSHGLITAQHSSVIRFCAWTTEMANEYSRMCE